MEKLSQFVWEMRDGLELRFGVKLLILSWKLLQRGGNKAKVRLHFSRTSPGGR